VRIDTKCVGTVNVLVPQGPLVDEDAEAFIEVVKARLDAPNPRFVLEMHNVPYFDSRGIEGLVEAADELRQRGGRLRLASVPQTCREVLELTGQAQRFEFFDEAHDAVRSFL
jgi:anti-anti-sigma factor